MEGRIVTLVLVSPESRVLGQTAPFPVEQPWWQEVHDVVSAARERFGVEVTVVRLLEVERAQPPGGAVVYLAEASALPLGVSGGVIERVSARLAARALESSPRRAPFAELGGHRASLAWVQTAWPGVEDFSARQQRTWNLSSLWRVQRDDQSAWLKQVPHFLAHEAAVLKWLTETVPRVSPVVLASDSAGRVLLEHIAGEDCYGASSEQRAAFAVPLHDIQMASVSATEGLADLGVSDLRGMRFAEHLRAQLSSHIRSLPRVARFLDQLEQYLHRLEECGLPDTLVHGDFHPGNVRANGSLSTILDWGDSFLGNPGFDLLRLSEGCTEADAATLAQQWCARWQEYDPRCKPERALTLLRPLVPLRSAATYARFVANIEESEHPFHAPDVTTQLELAERALTERSSR